MKRYKYKSFYWISIIGYFILAGVFAFLFLKEKSPFDYPLDIGCVYIFIFLGFMEIWQYYKDHIKK